MTMAITPDGKTLYVSNYATCGSGQYVALGDSYSSGLGAGDTVTPIRTATGRPGHAIADGTVTPIRTTTKKAGRAIRVGRGPWVITITP